MVADYANDPWGHDLSGVQNIKKIDSALTPLTPLMREIWK